MKKLLLIITIFSLMSFTFKPDVNVKKSETETIVLVSGHAAKAKKLGYIKTNYRSHGQAVYHRSKAKSSLKYITPDTDSHNGGYWKAASSVKNLGSKSTRSGTYDSNLKRIGD